MRHPRGSVRDKKCRNPPESTNARWRSPKSHLGRSRYSASRRRRAIYDVWYTYATGYNPSLNQTINETLAQNGTLTDANLEQVYSTYISPTRFSDKIDSVGSRVMDEINKSWR